MKILSKIQNHDIASVYIAEMNEGKLVEFVESVQPPIPREKKWVFIVSTLYGCPVKCPMCDAGIDYQGKLSKDEMMAQINYLIDLNYPNRKLPIHQLKIQLARLGEPALNDNVLELLSTLPEEVECPGLMPSFSTIAPIGRENFFNRLIEIKNNYYPNGKFQFQFSIHSTNCKRRSEMIPVRTWDFKQMSDYGQRFFRKGDRKITLNFALSNEIDLSADVIRRYFSPEVFLIKITPVNPTINAQKNQLSNIIYNREQALALKSVRKLTDDGYDVIISIGELEENKIGSNCGQYIKHFLKSDEKVENSYTYRIEKVTNKEQTNEI